MKKVVRKWFVVPLIVVTVLVLVGCNGTPPAPPEPAATNTEAPTAEPTAMPTPIPPTATFTATPDLAATEAVLATQEAEELLKGITPVLNEVGVSPDRGSLGVVDDGPYFLVTRDYNGQAQKILADGQVFTNFVIHVDIKWKSTMGFAGCDIGFRGEEDLVRGAIYRMRAMRLSGLPAWDIEYWRYNSFQSNPLGEVKFSNAIDLKDGAVNTFIIVMDGKTATIYANGSRIGAATISQRESGVIGFYAWQDSGETSCEFSNIWVWELD